MGKSTLDEDLDLARGEIAQGNLEATLEWLMIAKHVAANTGMYLPTETVAAVLESAKEKGDVQAAYRKLVAEKLDFAKNRAGLGLLDYAIGYIEQAREYADPSGMELPEETVTGIFETAYKANIRERLIRISHKVSISEPTLTKIEELARQEGAIVAQAYLKRSP